MKTGVVMEIFCFASFWPVMNLKSRLKLPSDPGIRACLQGWQVKIPEQRTSMEKSVSSAGGTPGSESKSIKNMIGNAAALRKRTVWFMVMLGLLGAVLLYLSGQNYVSEAMLLVRYVFGEPSEHFEERIDSTARDLASMALARQVAKIVGPEKLLPSGVKAPTLDAAALVVSRNLMVAKMQKSGLIALTFRHRDPEVAREVLKQLLTAYLNNEAAALSRPGPEALTNMESRGFSNFTVIQEATPSETVSAKVMNEVGSILGKTMHSIRQKMGI